MKWWKFAYFCFFDKNLTGFIKMLDFGLKMILRRFYPLKSRFYEILGFSKIFEFCQNFEKFALFWEFWKFWSILAFFIKIAWKNLLKATETSIYPFETIQKAPPPIFKSSIQWIYCRIVNIFECFQTANKFSNHIDGRSDFFWPTVNRLLIFSGSGPCGMRQRVRRVG